LRLNEKPNAKNYRLHFRLKPINFRFHKSPGIALALKCKNIGEIIYRVELPDMEEITMIYLENNDADYSKSCKQAKQHSQNSIFQNSLSILFILINVY
jgi:hypothetical protein